MKQHILAFFLGLTFLSRSVSAQDNYADALYQGHLESQLRAVLTHLDTQKIDDAVIIPLSMYGRDDVLETARRLYPIDQYLRRTCFPASGTHASDDMGLILTEAAKVRFVVINEAHDEPSHRLFVLDLIRHLRALGYNKYAAETLGAPTTALQTDGYARNLTGFFTNESTFADLLENAIALGFHPLAYEIRGVPKGLTDLEARQYRETTEAQNVLSQVGPGDKVIIHVGYGHVRKYPRTRDTDTQAKDMMATELERLSGENILTIDQTECRDSTLASGKWSLKLPDPSDRYVDIQIAHPEQDSFIGGRALWRFYDGRVPVSLPWSSAALAKMSRPILFTARWSQRLPDAVPADRVFMSGNEDVKLALKTGDYTIVATDGIGRVISSKKLAVPASAKKK